MLTVLIVTLGIICFIWISYYIVLLVRLRFRNDQLDILNTLYVFSNNEIYFGYELIDFKKTILLNKIEFCNFKEGVFIKYELTDENRRRMHHLTKDEQVAIRNATSNPLSENQKKVIEDAIKTSREHMQLIKEQENYNKLDTKYKKANKNKTTVSGLNTMTDFQKELEEEEQLYKEKIKSLQLDFSH